MSGMPENPYAPPMESQQEPRRLWPTGQTIWFLACLALGVVLFTLVPTIGVVIWDGIDPTTGRFISGKLPYWQWWDVAIRITIPVALYLFMPIGKPIKRKFKLPP